MMSDDIRAKQLLAGTIGGLSIDDFISLACNQLDAAAAALDRGDRKAAQALILDALLYLIEATTDEDKGADVVDGPSP